MALEQETAALALLNASLAQSSRSTDRATYILGELDTRLARLERSVLPLHRQTSRYSRMSKNLASSIRSVDSLLGHHDLAASESVKIAQKPTRDDVDEYLAVMDRVSTAYQAMKQADSSQYGPTLQNTLGLLETGSDHLISLFSDILQESCQPFDAGQLYDQGRPFPTLSTDYYARGVTILTFLRGLPDIATKSATSAETTYADARSRALVQSLEGCQKDALASAAHDAVDADTKGFGRLIDVAISLVKAEYGIAATALGDASPSARRAVMATIAAAVAQNFSSTGQTLNGQLKRSITTQSAVAFQTFGELQERQSEFDDWFRSKCGRKENELGDLAHSFRGTCLTSLPEKMNELQTWGKKAPTSSDGNISTVSTLSISVSSSLVCPLESSLTEQSQTIEFMRSLCDRASIVEPLLKTLGPSNWGSTADHHGDSLLPVYIEDLLNALLTALESKSQTLRHYKSGTSAIFLLNNISYVRREVLSTQVGDVLGEEWEDKLNKQMRAAKSGYLEVWSPLVAALMDPNPEQSGAASALKAGLSAVAGNVEKRETKDRFLRFNEALSEVETLHANVAKLDPGEGELRDRLRIEVQRMICPTYQKFAARSGEHLRQPSKYKRLDPDQLAERINAVFA